MDTDCTQMKAEATHALVWVLSLSVFISVHLWFQVLKEASMGLIDSENDDLKYEIQEEAARRRTH